MQRHRATIEEYERDVHPISDLARVTRIRFRVAITLLVASTVIVGFMGWWAIMAINDYRQVARVWADFHVELTRVDPVFAGDQVETIIIELSLRNPESFLFTAEDCTLRLYADGLLVASLSDPDMKTQTPRKSGRRYAVYVGRMIPRSEGWSERVLTDISGKALWTVTGLIGIRHQESLRYARIAVRAERVEEVGT